MIENGHLVLRIPDECLLMDEIHMHNTELRSSAESLSELQKSEGGEPCPTKSKTSNHLDWCGPWYKSNWYQGNFADTLSSQPSVFLHTKNHSCDQEEVNNYFCHFFVCKSSVNSGLQNGDKIGTSLWSGWTTIWRITSLEQHEDSTAERVRKTWSTKFLRWTVPSTWKRFENCEESKNLGLLLSNSRTLWWNTDWPSWWCTLEIFTIWIVHLSQGLVSHHPIFSWEQTDIWVNESDKGRQTFFTPLNLIGGDPDEEEPVMTAQFLKVSHNHPVHKIKGCNSGKRSLMRSSCTIMCQQSAST